MIPRTTPSDRTTRYPGSSKAVVVNACVLLIRRLIQYQPCPPPRKSSCRQIVPVAASPGGIIFERFHLSDFGFVQSLKSSDQSTSPVAEGTHPTRTMSPSTTVFAGWPPIVAEDRVIS